MKSVTRRLLAIIMSVAMVFTFMPLGGSGFEANAETINGAGYIKVDGVTYYTVKDKSSDAVYSNEGLTSETALPTGISWDASEQLLTLTNFTGNSLEVSNSTGGVLNLKLVGTSTLSSSIDDGNCNMTSSGEIRGINVSYGGIVIDDSAGGTLNVNIEGNSEHRISGIYSNGAMKILSGNINVCVRSGSTEKIAFGLCSMGDITIRGENTKVDLRAYNGSEWGVGMSSQKNVYLGDGSDVFIGAYSAEKSNNQGPGVGIRSYGAIEIDDSKPYSLTVVSGGYYGYTVYGASATPTPVFTDSGSTELGYNGSNSNGYIYSSSPYYIAYKAAATETGITASDLSDSIPAPVEGCDPITFINDDKYTAHISWSPEALVTYGAETAYTATVTYVARKGYTFDGLATGDVAYTGAKSEAGAVTFTPSGDGKTLTAVIKFAATAEAVQVSDATVRGITAPVAGYTPVTEIANGLIDSEYKGTITWTETESGAACGKYFDAQKSYTATVALTAKGGYTFKDLSAGFLSVAGATSATLSGASGNKATLTVVFPKTGDYDKNLVGIGNSIYNVTGSLPGGISWDAENERLVLNGYSGGSIHAMPGVDLSIYVKGTNTITADYDAVLTGSGTHRMGLYSPCNVIVDGDEGAALTINVEVSDSEVPSGIIGDQSVDIENIDCTINSTAKGISAAYGIGRYKSDEITPVTVGGTADLTVNAVCKTNAAYGIRAKSLDISTSGDVAINCGTTDTKGDMIAVVTPPGNQFRITGTGTVAFDLTDVPEGWPYSENENEKTYFSTYNPAITADNYFYTDGSLTGQNITLKKGKIVSEGRISLDCTEYTYDGNAKTPAVSFAGLIQDTDYTVSYEKNTLPNSSTNVPKVVISGKGSMVGSMEIPFTIKPIVVDSLNITVSNFGFGNNISDITATCDSPGVEVKAVEVKEMNRKTGDWKAYSSTTLDCRQSGVSVYIKFKDGYVPGENLYKTTAKNGLENISITGIYGVDGSEYTYANSPGAVAADKRIWISGVAPESKCTTHTPDEEWHEGNGYHYHNCSVCGALAGRESCSGSYVEHAVVTPSTIEGDVEHVAAGTEGKVCSKCGDVYNNVTTAIDPIGELYIDWEPIAYNGKPHDANIVIMTTEGEEVDTSNYDVEYTNNINAGTATATLTFKNRYSGTASLDFEIEKSAQGIDLSKTSYTKTYGNSAFSLGATKLVNGLMESEYDITFPAIKYASNNTKVATVSSTGKVTIKGVGKAKITVSADGTANLYKAPAKTVTIKVNPKKPTISKLTVGKTGTKKLTVKMGTKVSATGGTTYKVQYRVKGTSKWTTKTTTSQIITLKSLKKGKKYQVRVCAYKKAGSETFTGSWSAIKTSGAIK